VKPPIVEVQIRDFVGREGLGCEQAVCGLLRARQPSLRFTTADQVASAVLYLASDAADNITRINLAMDGGWPAQQSFTAGRRVFCH
jgi:3-hydroxybutyrate dehydrogenase